MSEPPDARSCQIHVDPLSGRSVFVAPARAERPREESLDACPFCAGNEHLTPDEVLRSPADRASKTPGSPITPTYSSAEASASGGFLVSQSSDFLDTGNANVRKLKGKEESARLETSPPIEKAG